MGSVEADTGGGMSTPPDKPLITDFSESEKLQERFHKAIPGGAHTYAKGDDQFPEGMPLYVTRGMGCHVWDRNGNEYIEYGMGLRAVSLGHAYAPVIEAAHSQMLLGSNFVRPATIELECAEAFLEAVPSAEMVKFGKNGSDATSAAIKLSRAYTGRDLVAICAEHPFFSVDDWFIGSTQMSAGIPRIIRDLTVKFHYNDPESLKDLFALYPGRIACVILEAEKDVPPQADFLHRVRKMCHDEGTVFIIDEMINGLRLHVAGGHGYHNVDPDLSAFGKALGNGFSISALAGKREIMQLGGLQHSGERVFLMSLTHGAETHCLAAARAILQIYRTQPVVETLWKQGERLARGVTRAVTELGLGRFFATLGRPCCMVYATRDHEGKPSQLFRTLFLQETIRRGLLAPSFVVSYSHTDDDIDRTIQIVHEALSVYRNALDEGIAKYLPGRPVKPVFRPFN